MITRFKTMRLALGALLAALFLAGAVQAADVKDGRAMVTPAKDDRYSIDGFTFGKAELFGYISDLKDTKKITGIVLKNGKKASDEQKRVIGSVGKGLQIEAFVLEGKELVPIAAQ
ncbi:hypothetical protein ACQQ2N_18700 [Dokdonella sp. MW10]|uniref:hypothetical protein n=1 Tax=Dokdonella sp. MW10 TaxID=2992926 RepID=UPI003F7E99D8